MSPAQIVLVEDNPGDVMLVELALRENGIPFELTQFNNGSEALQALSSPEAQSFVPDIILLDLNTPKSDGFQVLILLRQSPRLSRVPIAILTSSQARTDKHRAALQNVRYIQKPSDLANFLTTVGQAVREMLHPCTDSGPQTIIVIGASSGGVEALRTLVAGLPADLPAAVFVVLHIGNHPSSLPEILNKAGPLFAIHPPSGAPIVHGNIYVAPPDRHLLIEQGCICLSSGPKENRSRPAVNPLFRSAAAAYGSRVTGVILTGGLDDGTAGLAEIKRCGGTAVVQDPKTAFSPSMPGSAVAHVDVDHIVPLNEIAALLSTLASTAGRPTEENRMQKEPLERHFSGLTCPECRGPLTQERQGRIVEYRCRVGHAYGPLALIEEHNEAVERTLWSTLVALEEAAEIAERMADGPYGLSPEEIRKKREQITLIRNMLDASA